MEKMEGQYLITLSTGKILRLFYKENTGICMSVLDKNKEWQDAIVLAKTTLPDFSACIDPKDNLHILCQNPAGSILYITGKAGAWNTIPILTSRNPAQYDKHLQITQAGGNTYFLYCLLYEGKKLLSYQYRNAQGILSKPKVIDYLPDGNKPYQLVTDSRQQLYLFYRFADDRNGRLGYRTYQPSHGQWGEFNPLTQYTGESEVLTAAFDTDASLHVCWQRKAGQTYELLYSRKKSSADAWDSETLLHTASSPFDTVSLLFSDNKPAVCRCEEKAFVYRISRDNGSTWDDWQERPFSGNAPLLVHYLSNLPENRPQHGNRIPAEITQEGFHLSYPHKSDTTGSLTTADGLRTLITKTMTELSSSYSTLSKTVREANDAVESITMRQNHMELAIEKHEAKLELMEALLAKFTEDLDNMKRLQEHISVNPFPADAGKHREEAEDENLPVMPGAGFSSITAQYLRNMTKHD